MTIEVMTIDDLLWSDDIELENWLTYVKLDGSLSYIESVVSIPFDELMVEVTFSDNPNVGILLPMDTLVYRNTTPTICSEDWCDNYTRLSEKGLEVARTISTSLAHNHIFRKFNLILIDGIYTKYS